MSKKNYTRSRGWCFTVNNYDDDDVSELMDLYESDDKCQYLILGFESGDRKHTRHVQGYIYYRDARSFEKMKKILGDIHIEPQNSKTNVSAYVYCMEEGDFHEMGDRPRQGHRTDLEAIKHDLKNGKTLNKVADEYFSQWVYHRRAFNEYRKMKIKYDTNVVIYDDETVHKIYESDLSEAFVVKEYDEDSYIHKFLHLYHSGTYKTIYFPYSVYKINQAVFHNGKIRYHHIVENARDCKKKNFSKEDDEETYEKESDCETTEVEITEA